MRSTLKTMTIAVAVLVFASHNIMAEKTAELTVAQDKILTAAAIEEDLNLEAWMIEVPAGEKGIELENWMMEAPAGEKDIQLEDWMLLPEASARD